MAPHPHAYPSDVEAPVSVRRFVQVVHAYSPVIILAVGAIMVVYLIAATIIYLAQPTHQTTTIPFRVNFEGANRGQYPNGSTFSPADIVSTPILLKVFNDNKLERLMTFPAFARSVFVVESNPAYEALLAEYHARLSEPRLTAVDRERIQSDFELKRASLNKNQYSINYIREEAISGLTETIARKVLSDTLMTWAHFAEHEQHVLAYEVPLLSPESVRDPSIDPSDHATAIQILRGKAMRVLQDLDLVSELPAVELKRTQKEKLSIADIRLRLEEIVRYRLEPLMQLLAPEDRNKSMRLLQTQLAFDKRALHAQIERASAIRDALTMYAMDQRTAAPEFTPPSGARERNPATAGEALIPQMSESFLDRLIELGSSSSDRLYRRELAEQYREALIAVAPLQQAVAYDEHVISIISQGGRPGEPAVIASHIEATRNELRNLIGQIQEIHRLVSRNLNPATYLYTVTAPASKRSERSINIGRLAKYGVLVFFLSIPLAIILSLLHARVRDEERAEQEMAADIAAVEGSDVHLP